MNAIEQALADRRAEIIVLEQQLVEVRNLVAGPSPQRDTPLPPSLPVPSSLLFNGATLDEAIIDPNEFFDRLGAGDIVRQVSAERLNDRVSQPIFDRPNLPSGISAALTLGNSKEASVNYSHPIILRDDYPNGYKPEVLTISVGLFTPLNSGVGTLLDDTDRNRLARANRDIPTGTRIRLGFDFLSFPKIENNETIVVTRRDTARRRVVDVLYAAREICLKHYATPSATPAITFYAPYDTSPPPPYEESVPAVTTALSTPASPQEVEARKAEVNGLCSGDNLARFIVGQQDDATSPSGAILINPELAQNFLGAFWNAGSKQLPAWGAGLSVELGTTDFAFRQSINPITLIPDTVAADAGFPDRVSASIDPSAGFLASETDSRNSWTVRGYGLFSLQRETPETRTPEWFVPGITLVGSAEYTSNYSSRPGTTKLSICPAQPVDPLTMQPRNVSIQCGTFDVDAPVETESFTLAAEARFRFLNIPVIRTLSFAPRYSHRLDDGAQAFDFPIYLQNDANGLGSAGLRYRHRWGGRDLLGNPDFSASEVSVFFVPLRFNGL